MAAQDKQSANRGAGKRGRKAGAWTHVEGPEVIVEYRERHRLSRLGLSGLLGVSHTSIQNWEQGQPPNDKLQMRLRDLLAGPPPGVDGEGGTSWSLVQPEEVEAYRQQERVSPYRLAVERLNVPPSLVAAWLHHRTAVPSLLMQRRLRTLLDGDPRPEWGPSLPRRLSREGHDAVMAATGRIVASYLDHVGGIEGPQPLTLLIRRVRQSLSS